MLRDTLGTIIFQDQVIEVALAFAGFSPGEAEGLRRAMSRKRSAAAIGAYHERFVEGAMARCHDVDEAPAERVWTMVVGFSGFGFPKAHGAAFGLLAYQSTWLRVHYGPEFLCALLDEQPMGFYPPDALVHEAQRRGIEVLPPTSTRSAVGLHGRRARRRGVRLGLGYVLGRAGRRGRGAGGRARGAAARSARWSDLASRAGAGRPALEQLAWSGACDALAGGGRRRRAAARRARCGGCGVARRPRRGDARRARATPALAAARRCPSAPALAPLGGWEAMIADYATTGLTTGAHPLGLLRDELRGAGGRQRATCAAAPRARGCGSAGSSSRASAPAPPRASSSCCSRTSTARSTSSCRRRSTSATGSSCAPSRW